MKTEKIGVLYKLTADEDKWITDKEMTETSSFFKSITTKVPANFQEITEEEKRRFDGTIDTV